VLPRSVGFKAFENAIALDIAMAAQPTPSCICWPSLKKRVLILRWPTLIACPKLCRNCAKVAPNANKYHIEDVHRAGGIMAILAELNRAGKLHTDVPTVHAKTLGEALAQWDITANPSDAVKSFYMAGPAGIPSQVAFSPEHALAQSG